MTIESLQVIASGINMARDWETLQVVQEIEAENPHLAVYVVPAEQLFSLSGGKGRPVIPFKVNLRDIPWYARPTEGTEWCRRVLNDSSGGKHLTRSERIEGYTTSWQNRCGQTKTRATATDDLTKALRAAAVELGVGDKKQVKTMNEQSLRAILPLAIVDHEVAGIALKATIAKGIR